MTAQEDTMTVLPGAPRGRASSQLKAAECVEEAVAGGRGKGGGRNRSANEGVTP
jgi:hypothetical protein